MRLTAQGVACCAPTEPRNPARRPYGRRALRIAYSIIPFQPNGGVFVGAQHATPSRPQGEACSQSFRSTLRPYKRLGDSGLITEARRCRELQAKAR